jgi:hypothetical protein
MRCTSTCVLGGILIATAAISAGRASSLPAAPESGEQAGEELSAVRLEPAMAQLRRARYKMVEGDAPAAATGIRQAAASLTREAGRVGERPRAALEAATALLGTLADAVQRGDVMAVEPVDCTVARMDLTLGAVFTAGAVEAWTHNERARVGRALDAAVSQLEDAAVWTGLVLDDTTAGAFGRGRWFAGRLIRDAASVPEDFHQAYEAVAAALDSLGRSLEAGIAASPFGPAGPRVGSPPSAPDGEAGPCGPEG